jgi:hypothetical protein
MRRSSPHMTFAQFVMAVLDTAICAKRDTRNDEVASRLCDLWYRTTMIENGAKHANCRRLGGN